MSYFQGELKDGFFKELCGLEFPLATGNDMVTIQMSFPRRELEKVNKLADDKASDYAKQVLDVVKKFVPKLSRDTAYDQRWNEVIQNAHQTDNVKAKFAMGVVLSALSPVHADICDHLARDHRFNRKMKRAVSDREECRRDVITLQDSFYELMGEDGANADDQASCLARLMQSEMKTKNQEAYANFRNQKLEMLQKKVPEGLSTALVANEAYADFMRWLIATSTTPDDKVSGDSLPVFFVHHGNKG